MQEKMYCMTAVLQHASRVLRDGGLRRVIACIICETSLASVKAN